MKESLNELALFAGAGGGILAGKLLGWRTVCAVEFEPHAIAILALRQNDKILEAFPIWDDIKTFDGKPWRGIVDVVSGGFPCQDISTAGGANRKGEGIKGKQSSLWTEMARIIREVGPRFVFVENSPILTSRGLDVVLGNLAEMGYDVAWGVFSAGDVGARHKRDRIWIVGKIQTDTNENHSTGEVNRGIHGHDNTKRRIRTKTSRRRRVRNTDGRHETGERIPDALGFDGSERWIRVEVQRSLWNFRERAAEWHATEPDLDRMVDGMAHQLDRLERLGNGQVPAVAFLAWQTLIRFLED